MATVSTCVGSKSGRHTVSLVRRSSDLSLAGAERPHPKGPLLSCLFAVAIFSTPGTSFFLFLATCKRH